MGYKNSFGIKNGLNGAITTPFDPSAIESDIAVLETNVTALEALVGNQQPTLNGLSSGGHVIWESAYTFRVSAATYIINGVLYTSPEQTITLDAADGSNDRIDVLVLDTAGLIQKVTGVAAAQPSEPDYDPSTQLKLTFILVAATSTEPEGVANENIYLENTEWTSSTSGTGFNANSTNNPRTGTKDIEGTAVANAAYCQLQRGSALALDSYAMLAFFIRSKATWANNRVLRLQFYLDGVAKGSPVTLASGYWGFDSSQLAAYQLVAIPLSQFVLPVGQTVNQLRITDVGGSIGFYIDDIILQAPGNSIFPTSTVGITEEQADARYLQQAIANYTSKNPPIGADSTFIFDSVTSLWKVLTFTNLLAFIKTYYDSVVSTLTNKTISGADNTLSNIPQSAVTDLTSDLAAKADLVGGKVPSSQLPSYVDDVEDYADFASLPVTGETGKIYLTTSDNKTYRWTGSVYAQVGGGSFTRADIVKTTASLADLAEETGTVALGKQAIVSIVSADKACRVRLYPTAAARTADLARPLGTAITEGDEEPLLEDSLTASKLTNSAPAATVFNGDGSPSSDIYYAIQNRSGSTGTVEVTFTVLILEA